MRHRQYAAETWLAPQLGANEARELVKVARQTSGVAISPDKLGFLEMRVGRRLREIGCADFRAYLGKLNGPEGHDERRHLVEALTTHTTAFFREKAHFDWMASSGLPALLEGGTGRTNPLVAWSAACSLGSELWTAAMVIDRYARNLPGRLDWEVVGTDISRKILRRAAQAVFTPDEIADLPEDYRRDYLLRSKPGASISAYPGRARADQLLYRIAPELRQRARLAQANIVDLSAAFNLQADIAFLRNVLIYFNSDDKRRAVENVVNRLRQGGYLVTGHSESLGEVPAGLRQIGASIYQKVKTR